MFGFFKKAKKESDIEIDELDLDEVEDTDIEEKTLEEANLERQEVSEEEAEEQDFSKPVAPSIPAPVPQAPSQEWISEPEPIETEDLSDLLEKSAKSLLDSYLNTEKASVDLKKILIKLSNNDTAVEQTIDGIISQIHDINSKIRNVSDIIIEYKQKLK